MPKCSQIWTLIWQIRTVEQENIGSPSFLDVKICRKSNKFVISDFKNPVFSGVSPIRKVSFQRTKREDFYTHTDS